MRLSNALLAGLICAALITLPTYATVADPVDQIPEELMNIIEEDGWHIELAEDNTLSNRLGFDYKICAATIYDNKTIYVENRAYDKSTLIHEIGHVLDYMDDFNNTYSSEFESIWKQEKKAFSRAFRTDKNNYNTAHEYFAESLAMYALHPVRLKEACPQTFVYLDTQYSDILGEK